MTISTNVNTQPFSGDGVVTSFSVTDFKILSSDHVRLYLYDGTTTTLLTKDVDWSIVLNGDQETSPGGSVTYPLSGSPLPSGQSLVALRYVPLVQGADLYNQGGALAEVVEDALDRLTMISQQTAEVNDRTIKLDVADPRTADEFRDALFATEINSAASATAAATAQGLAETAQAAAETAQGLAETAQAAAETAQAGAEAAEAAVDAAIAAQAVLKSSATGSAQVPTGTTAQRDGTPAAGMFRFNNELGQFEGHNGINWGSVGGGATGGGGDQVFVMNDLTVNNDFTIPATKGAHSVGPITVNAVVTVDGVWVIN